jgi:hypothetical protein
MVSFFEIGATDFEVTKGSAFLKLAQLILRVTKRSGSLKLEAEQKA